MRLTENKYKSRKFTNGAWEGRFRSCVHFSLVESNPQAEIPFSSSALWSQRKNSRLLGLSSIPGEFSRWTSKLVSSLTHPVGTAHIALPDSLYLSPLRQFQIALVGVQSWETLFKILLLIDLNSENILIILAMGRGTFPVLLSPIVGSSSSLWKCPSFHMTACVSCNTKIWAFIVAWASLAPSSAPSSSQTETSSKQQWFVIIAGNLLMLAYQHHTQSVLWSQGPDTFSSPVLCPTIQNRRWACPEGGRTKLPLLYTLLSLPFSSE